MLQSLQEKENVQQTRAEQKANGEFSVAIAWIPVWDLGSLGLQGLFP